MDEIELLKDDGGLGESARWHDGRLWYCDWVLGQLVAVGPGGAVEVIETPIESPWSIDWLPDGRMLATTMGGLQLLRVEADGTAAVHAELGDLSEHPWNELVVDGRGNAYVNGIGYDMMGGAPPAPGLIVLVTPDGAVRPVADDLHFPNGMALTPDGSTLIVAESHATRLTAFTIAADGSLEDRRTFAQLGPDDAPDGISIDAEGAVWYTSVPGRHCVRVADGGAVLQTVEVDRACFSCSLGGPDGHTLFIVAADWADGAVFYNGERTGQVLAIDVDVAAGGWP